MSALYVAAVDAGRSKLFRASLRKAVAGAPVAIVADHNNTAFSFDQGMRTISWIHDASDRPAEVYVGTVATNAGGGWRAPAHARERRARRAARGEPRRGLLVHRRRRNEGPGLRHQAAELAAGQEVSGRAADPRRTAGREWLDQWHGRWNYQMFAAKGFGAGDHQPARLVRLRSEVRRRRVARLGRQGRTPI